MAPSGGEAAGDQDPAAGIGGAGEDLGDVGGVVDVVEDQQPSGVGGQPLHSPRRELLHRQHRRQFRFQGGGEAGQSLLDLAGAGGGDPPDRGTPVWPGGGPLDGQGALADPAEPVHRMHHHRGAVRGDRVQAIQFRGAAHEPLRPQRQVIHPRRCADVRDRP
ncbi:hypothetical protein [Nocardia sp. alder85J]|uniref:hypothetical protein n=1 Tax=Nocardia sp. alder85J TaxID=2862949 RepID=UPI002255AB2F|nr:hypothetical protein [Nocardia sp. alder85J]MCX4099071.1 hypothetical protein [Nocardia sp. alder85J]